MSGHHSTTRNSPAPPPGGLLRGSPAYVVSFTGAAIAGAIFVALLLIGMAVFLL